jgi:predicted metal-dependent peptidase
MYFRKCENELFEKYKNIFNSLLIESETLTTQPEAMDEKTFEQFHLRISRCKNFLDENHPWFGIFLSKLRTVPTYDLPTMGVDDYGNIYINPKFALEKSEKETIGVLAHEVMHVITLTFFRQHSRDMTLWNIATDFIMNKMLLESGFTLPKEGCLPIKRGDSWIVELKDETTGQPYGEIDVTNMHEEKFYDEMVKLLEQNNKNKKPKNPQTGPNKVYQPGDRVKSRVTGLKGTVTAVKGLQPGKQDLTIKWD